MAREDAQALRHSRGIVDVQEIAVIPAFAQAAQPVLAHDAVPAMVDRLVVRSSGLLDGLHTQHLVQIKVHVIDPIHPGSRRWSARAVQISSPRPHRKYRGGEK